MPLEFLPQGVSYEAVSIGFAGLLVYVSILVQHFSNAFIRGPGYVLSNRSKAPDQNGFFGRATRAVSNNIESAVMYVPPTLVLLLLHKSAPITLYAALTYMAMRLIFVVCYWLGVTVIRSMAWNVGMIAIGVMYWAATRLLFGL